MCGQLCCVVCFLATPLVLDRVANEHLHAFDRVSNASKTHFTSHTTGLKQHQRARCRISYAAIISPCCGEESVGGQRTTWGETVRLE